MTEAARTPRDTTGVVSRPIGADEAEATDHAAPADGATDAITDGLTDGGRPSNWTEAEIATLTGMWGSGATNHEIGLALGRKENAVAIKASRLHLPRKEVAIQLLSEKRRGGRKSKIRPCLCCRRPFFSEGAHHRICDPCKAVRSGSTSDYAILMGGAR